MSWSAATSEDVLTNHEQGSCAAMFAPMDFKTRVMAETIATKFQQTGREKKKKKKQVFSARKCSGPPTLGWKMA